MPADSRGLGPNCMLPRGGKKLWRDTAITHGALHTSLATEYPSATHGRASVPEWLNKITFKSSARWFPDEHSSVGRDYFQADSVSDGEEFRQSKALPAQTDMRMVEVAVLLSSW